jgi:parvulin-like peptidyl-prolyl isomerase
MDRRLTAGMLGLLLSGCALSRAKLPESAMLYPPVGSVDSLPQINKTINRVEAPPVDPAARRVSQRPPNAETPGSVVATSAVDGPPPIPERRPAPPPDPRAEEPPAIPASTPGPGKPEDGPAPPPVASPGPQASDPPPLGAPPLGPARVADAGPTADPQVVQASTDAGPTPREILDPASSSGEAAMVGQEIITVQQLKNAIQEKKAKIPPEEWADPEVKLAVTKGTLESLIQRSLLCQAARKKLKDMKAFNENMDKLWVEQELPPLLKEYNVPNVYQLKARLKASGKSLDQIREDFRLTMLAQSYLVNQVKPKLTVSLPERYKYYNDNLSKFNRPAQVVWREIEIDIDKCPNRAEAQRKAEAILARLQKGEDWAKVARAESHGATARDGGRWETAPGSHANADINEALNNLPAGRFTKVIEVPGAFHIVGVESRREAGPARFDEVQAEIQKILMDQKTQALCATEVESLRSKTVVTTLFDRPPTDPAAIRTSAPR